MFYAELRRGIDTPYCEKFDTYNRIPVRITEAPHSPYKTGYGRRIPTRYLIFIASRWRRVYVAQYGNAGSAYIGNFEYFVDIYEN